MSIPLPNACDRADIHAYYMLPEVFTPSYVDALADIHSRSHSFPLIHPGKSAWLGCWVIIRPLFSHGIFFLSLPLGVGLFGWGWYICPGLGRHPCTGKCQFLMHRGEVYCGGGFITVCIGPSLHREGRLS